MSAIRRRKAGDNRRLLRIEQQKHAIAAAQEHMPPRFLHDEFQHEDIGVERPGCVQIGDVQTGFKNAFRFHGIVGWEAVEAVYQEAGKPVNREIIAEFVWERSNPVYRFPGLLVYRSTNPHQIPR